MTMMVLIRIYRLHQQRRNPSRNQIQVPKMDYVNADDEVEVVVSWN
jgi:hypothetical protein